MITAKVHESRFPLLETKFRNINKKLKGQGQIGYKVTGTSLGPYIDSNGLSHDDGLYFEIETDGVARFNGMEYVGKIDVTGGDKNVIRPFGTITDDEFTQMSAFHGTECACCNSSRKRNELYVFRCTEDVTNPDNGDTYKAGKLYPVGSKCINKFTGIDAMSIVEEIAGELDLSKISTSKKTRPMYVDTKKFMTYAMQVANTQLDEAYAFYRKHRTFKVDTPEQIYDVAMNSPQTYRKCIGTTVEEMVGNITRTALATYRLCEDGYIDRSFFKDDVHLRQFKGLMKACDFESGLQKMEKTVETISNLYADPIESDNMLIKIGEHNVSALTGTTYMHESHAQKLVDVCDAYFLARGSCAIHEEKIAPYSIDNYGNAIGDMAVGKNESVNVKIYNHSYYGHDLNSKELTKLYNGYPVLLTDCVDKKRKFSTVVSLLPSDGGGYKLRADSRFVHHGQIDTEALKRYKPSFGPENARIAYTLEKPLIMNGVNQALRTDMKTGEKESRYGSIDIAKQAFNYYKNSNLVKGAGQFEIITTSPSLWNKMLMKTEEIADYVDERMGIEESGLVGERILLSEPVSVDGKKMFRLVYTGFAEDNESAKQCQETIKQVLDDQFSDYEISDAKPVSDVEIVSLKNHQAETKAKLAAVPTIPTRNTSLNDSLLTEPDVCDGKTYSKG